MRVKRGSENEYRAWQARRRMTRGEEEMIDACEKIAAHLENERIKVSPGQDALDEALDFVKEMSLYDVTQVVLVISLFHERGDVLRFAWNKHYCGEDWALERERTNKRLYDPN
ncbi:hypothetical protein KGO95_02285 [Patescibacteria group bacterium]|nr:hypothetical protein [Patescibacteria group bacterium]